MDHWRQHNTALVPQQGQPATLSTNDQPRRPLAINDMLNHGPAPPRWFGDARHPPSAGYHSQLPPPIPMEPPPELYHRYLPEPSRPAIRANQGLGLRPAPPIGTNDRWNRDYHMSHPQEMGFDPHDNLQRSQGLSTTAAKLDVNRKRKCVICLEKFEGTDPKSQFPHQCKKCASGDFCADCLKGWFLDACKNESKMPPKCCTIVPLSAVRYLLNSSQIELYKAKYEEWATVDRIYCPVPTCSTFLPQRLYFEILEGPSTPHNISSISNTFNQAQHTQPKKQVKQHIACPTCWVSVCTKCRSYSHIGNCPESDIDPILEEQLKKWKIKRCPKCRAGVRKMFGCSHIECRCGAHFCFGCLFPIDQCQGQCDDEVDPNDFDVAEDDLDGRGFDEGGELDFGPEPYGNVIDAWGCQHVWSRVILPNAEILRRYPLECNRCFRDVHPIVQDKPQPNIAADTKLTSTTQPWPTNHYGESGWQCFRGHLACQRCPKIPPAHRQRDATWLWTCDCGNSCVLCDKVEAMMVHAKGEKHAWEQKEKEDSEAWACRCGMTLCSACKVASQAT